MLNETHFIIWKETICVSKPKLSTTHELKEATSGIRIGLQDQVD